MIVPSTDSENLRAEFTARAGSVEGALTGYIAQIHQHLDQLPELVNYTTTVDNNKIVSNIRIVPQEQRVRTSMEIEEVLMQAFSVLEQQGLMVKLVAESNGPTSSSVVGINLLAKSSDDLEKLTMVARDFRVYLSAIPGAKNITSSSEESPGQFVFRLDKEKLALLGLTPASIGPELYLALNGISAGTIKNADMSYDIVLKYFDFEQEVSPEMLLQTMVVTPIGKVSLGSIGSYIFKPSVTHIGREKGSISVTLGADLQQGFKAEEVNEALYTFAEKYDFPEGISYVKGGEREENADLIIAILSGLVIAVVLIFSILVLQFNSYTQPLVISYSILMGFMGASYGMLVTSNPYSMMFMIGFLALMGIVVNNAIILIDTANENVKHGESRAQAIIESAKSRIQPILSTTLTTVIGMATLTSDGFFAPLAYTIMFGLTFATVITLFAVPALYHDEQKLRILIKRVL